MVASGSSEGSANVLLQAVGSGHCCSMHLFAVVCCVFIAGNGTVGCVSGAIEVAIQQPWVGIKNAMQRSEPIPMNPAILYDSSLSIASPDIIIMLLLLLLWYG